MAKYKGFVRRGCNPRPSTITSLYPFRVSPPLTSRMILRARYISRNCYDVEEDKQEGYDRESKDNASSVTSGNDHDRALIVPKASFTKSQ